MILILIFGPLYRCLKSFVLNHNNDPLFKVIESILSTQKFKTLFLNGDIMYASDKQPECPAIYLLLNYLNPKNEVISPQDYHQILEKRNDIYKKVSQGSTVFL